MSTRPLAPLEKSTIAAAVARQINAIKESMVSAADDGDINRVRALLADYDMCVKVAELLRRDAIIVSYVGATVT